MSFLTWLCIGGIGAFVVSCLCKGASSANSSTPAKSVPSPVNPSPSIGRSTTSFGVKSPGLSSQHHVAHEFQVISCGNSPCSSVSASPTQPQYSKPSISPARTTPPRDAQGRFVSVRKPVPAAAPVSASPATPAAGGWFNGVGKTTSRPGKITVYSLSGAPLDLTPSNIRASGGEGTVYDVPGIPNVLVKIYKPEKLADTNKRKELTERISAMVKKTDLCNLPWLAWPCMGVFDANRQLIGFGMRKISGESFYTLETREKLRQRNWDRADLATVALDFVGKLELLAQHGVLVNDFNPSNFLFNDQHEVLLIDCDSFQVTDPQGKILPTRTFFPSHVAPELLADKSQLARPRDIHHLEFGAALTVFNILMNGLHPYSYFDPTHKSSCGSPEENLRKGRCPLGVGAQCKFPNGDWYKVWSHFTCRLKGAFIKTFRTGHADRNARTSLAQFRDALQEYLFVMYKDPVRRELFPSTVKPKEYLGTAILDDAGNF